MSRDRRGDGIQEVVSSILIGSTNTANLILERRPRGRRSCFASSQCERIDHLDASVLEIDSLRVTTMRS